MHALHASPPRPSVLLESPAADRRRRRILLASFALLSPARVRLAPSCPKARLSCCVYRRHVVTTTSPDIHTTAATGRRARWSVSVVQQTNFLSSPSPGAIALPLVGGLDSRRKGTKMLQRTTLEMIRYAQIRGLGDTWAPVDLADLVLTLLRIDDSRALAYVEDLTGRPITFCPPQLLPRPAPVIVRPRHGDDRLVLRARSQEGHRTVALMDALGVIPPRSPLVSLTGRSRIIVGTPMYDRMSAIRPGMSVSQTLSRGVTRRDLRIAERRGWLELEREPERAEI